jgi:D-3-phosphoglycerate dehydrogenase
MGNKVIVTPSSFGKCGNLPLELLKNENYEMILNPFGRKMTAEEVMTLGKECVGIIAGVEPLNSKVLKSLSSLRCISRVGVGIDNIDLVCAKELGIVVKNTPDGPTRAVAELTIGLIIDVLRKISYRDREIRKGNWPKEMGVLLQGKKVGILGIGRIGRTVAELLVPFGCEVLCCDINPDVKWCNKYKIPLLPLEDLLKQSDVICVHAACAADEMPLLGKKELEMMKKGVFLINMSRGGVVDEKALYHALKTNRLGGAALDVFCKEPYSGPFTELDNVVLTPHIGSYAKEARLEMEVQAVQNLLDVIKK